MRADRGIDVARQREVEHDQRPRRPRAPIGSASTTRPVAPVEEITTSASAMARGRARPSPIARPSSDCREPLGALGAAVGDDEVAPTPRRRSVAPASAPIDPAPTITSAAPSSVPSDAGGMVERDRDDRRAGRSMPVSVCTRLPTRSAVWVRSCSTVPERAGFGAERVGRAQLAEDLRLADHHRVEPGRHGEHVLDGGLGEVDVEVVGEIGDGQPGVPGQHAC